MTKLARPIVLAFAMAALAGGAMTSAQDKKGTTQGKKDEKKEVKGKVEYYEASDGWRIRVVGAEGKSLAIGTKHFEKKEDAIKQLEEIKAILDAVKPSEGEPSKKEKEKKEKDKDKGGN
jgi:hypothetical protein